MVCSTLTAAHRMAFIPQITFRNVQPSAAVAARILTATRKLARFGPNITRCSVLVEAEHRHQRRGEPFRVRIHLHAPRTEIVVRQQPRANGVSPRARRFSGTGRHKDMYVAVHDAFAEARRRLEDSARRIRSVKHHQPRGAL
jgi:ribosome-associated translation inhibitor RaiA